MSDVPGEAERDAGASIPPPVSWLPPEPASPEPASAEPVTEPTGLNPPAVDAGPDAVPVGVMESDVASVAVIEPPPDPAPIPEPAPAPTPFPDPSPLPEPTPTSGAKVTQTTAIPEPPTISAQGAPSAQPSAAEKAMASTAAHPEYLVGAALIAGFLLAKVVKRLAR